MNFLSIQNNWARFIKSSFHFLSWSPWFLSFILHQYKSYAFPLDTMLKIVVLLDRINLFFRVAYYCSFRTEVVISFKISKFHFSFLNLKHKNSYILWIYWSHKTKTKTVFAFSISHWNFFIIFFKRKTNSGSAFQLNSRIDFWKSNENQIKERTLHYPSRNAIILLVHSKASIVIKPISSDRRHNHLEIMTSALTLRGVNRVVINTWYYLCNS